MTLDGRGGLHRPSRGLKEALAFDTHGALELPWVWLKNNPFGKGTILLLLGPQAALTTSLMPLFLRPRLLEAMVAGCDSRPSPGVQRSCDAEVDSSR